MAGQTKYRTASEYFAAQPELIRRRLLELRDIILKAAPQATETLNYNIPAYTLVPGGKRDQQIMIAGYSSHIGFYPHPTTMEHFATELAPYKKGKGSVQFPLDSPLPEDLIVRMVKYRVGMLG